MSDILLMPSFRKRCIRATLSTNYLFSLVLVCASAHAQTAPDAGQLQRQIEQNLGTPAASKPPAAASPIPKIDHSGPRITVRHFAISGASLIPSEELAAQLAPYVGQSLTLGELDAATQNLVSYYRELGWYVRVILPPQDTSAGTVNVLIIEGRFGSMLTLPSESGATRRANVQSVEKLVGHRLHAGQPYSQDDLERGLLLANDLPGIRADGILQAGSENASSDLALRVEDTALFSGQVGLNNGGSRFTGREQANAQLALNSPSGYGDQLALSAVASERLGYAALGYSLPLGNDGLRATLATTYLRYRLGEDFAALDARGNARTYSLGLSYPLYRSVGFSLWLGLDLTNGRYRDDSLGMPLRDRKVDGVALSLSGNANDDWGGGGFSQWRFVLGQSKVTLKLAADAALDAIGPQTAGNSTRLGYEIRRDQLLPAPLAPFYLRARLSGQQASGNLDSSQKFSLGGPYGVRGFPGDDGLGDSGMVLQLELHRPLSIGSVNGFDAFFFVDGGLIRQHQNTWAGWDTRRSGNNDYSLAATGLGLGWQGKGGLTLNAILARPLGNNPGSGINDRNQDGTRVATRFWLTLNQPF